MISRYDDVPEGVTYFDEDFGYEKFVLYTLDEPIETDISDLISFDGEIDVAEGDLITIEMYIARDDVANTDEGETLETFNHGVTCFEFDIPTAPTFGDRRLADDIEARIAEVVEETILGGAW